MLVADVVTAIDKPVHGLAGAGDGSDFLQEKNKIEDMEVKKIAVEIFLFMLIDLFII